MAEIKIQKKRRTGWIWIIAILIIIFIIWIVVRYGDFTNNGNQPAVVADSTSRYNEAPEDTSSNNGIKDFDQFVNNNQNPNDIAEYTKEGLSKLSMALNQVISNNSRLKEKLGERTDSLKGNLDKVKKNNNREMNSAEIKKAFLSCSYLMEGIKGSSPDSSGSSPDSSRISIRSKRSGSFRQYCSPHRKTR